MSGGVPGVRGGCFCWFVGLFDRSVRVFPDGDGEMFDAELSGLGVRGVEDIEAVSLDRAAAVEDGDDVSAGVVIE